jgi:hypothetical protein
MTETEWLCCPVSQMMAKFLHCQAVAGFGLGIPSTLTSMSCTDVLDTLIPADNRRASDDPLQPACFHLLPSSTEADGCKGRWQSANGRGRLFGVASFSTSPINHRDATSPDGASCLRATTAPSAAAADSSSSAATSTTTPEAESPAYPAHVGLNWQLEAQRRVAAGNRWFGVQRHTFLVCRADSNAK